MNRKQFLYYNVLHAKLEIRQFPFAILLYLVMERLFICEMYKKWHDRRYVYS